MGREAAQRREALSCARAPGALEAGAGAALSKAHTHSPQGVQGGDKGDGTQGAVPAFSVEGAGLEREKFQSRKDGGSGEEGGEW